MTAPGYENTTREDFDRELEKLENLSRPYSVADGLHLAFTAQAFRVNGGWAALTGPERQQYIDRIHHGQRGKH